MAVSDVESAPSAEAGVNLGSRLRLARQRSGLTLREVARRLGVSASFVSQLENGKSQPSVVTLYSLTQLLGVSIDQMFEEDLSPADGTPAPRAAGKRSAGQAARRHDDAADTADGASPISRSDLGSPADAWPQQESRPHWATTYPGNRPRLVMDSGVICMDSSVPHLLRNLGSVPARGIWCVHHEHA